MSFLFEKLTVYKKSIDFAEQISVVSDTFPKGSFYLRDQLNRAALSISTNIAEGNGRFHKKDRVNFFIISRGSVQECVPLMELAKRRGFIDNKIHFAPRAFRASSEKAREIPEPKVR